MTPRPAPERAAQAEPGSPTPPRRRVVPPGEALQRLQAWRLRAGEGVARAYLIQLDRLLNGGPPHGRPTTSAILWDRIRRGILEQRISVLEEILTLPVPDTTAEPAPPPPAPEPPPKKLDWVEIVLLDEEGVPVADEKFSIQLPDGSTREGTLDAEGKARVEEFEAGTCFVTFPEIKVRPRAGDSA